MQVVEITQFIINYYYYYYYYYFKIYHIVHISKQGVYFTYYFIRCKLYAAAVISVQFIVTMFIIILCICISLFCWKVPVFILLNIAHIQLQHPVRLRDVTVLQTGAS